MPFSNETCQAIVRAQLDAFDKMVDLIKADTEATEIERAAMIAEVETAKASVASEEVNINGELPRIVAAHGGQNADAITG